RLRQFLEIEPYARPYESEHTCNLHPVDELRAVLAVTRNICTDLLIGKLDYLVSGVTYLTLQPLCLALLEFSAHYTRLNLIEELVQRLCEHSAKLSLDGAHAVAVRVPGNLLNGRRRAGLIQGSKLGQHALDAVRQLRHSSHQALDHLASIGCEPRYGPAVLIRTNKRERLALDP